MKKRIGIEATDIYDKLFPVQAFFNAISDSEFVRFVDNYLTRGIGLCIDVCCCQFPADMDEYEREVERAGKPLEGIEFSVENEEVVVDVPTFRHYLTMACEAYVRDHPEDAAKIAELLARPQPPLDVPVAEMAA